MRRFQLFGTVLATILSIASIANSARLVIQRHAAVGYPQDFYLVQNNVLTKEQKQFLRVQLLCPDKKVGALRLISKNRLGETDHYIVGQANGRPSYLSIYNVDVEGKTVDPIIEVDILNSMDKDEISLATAMSQEGIRLWKTVCNGPETAKENYRERLNSNLKILGLRVADYPSKF